MPSMIRENATPCNSCFLNDHWLARSASTLVKMNGRIAARIKKAARSPLPANTIIVINRIKHRIGSDKTAAKPSQILFLASSFKSKNITSSLDFKILPVKIITWRRLNHQAKAAWRFSLYSCISFRKPSGLRVISSTRVRQSAKFGSSKYIVLAA